MPAVGAGPSPVTPFVPRRRRRQGRGSASRFGPASGHGARHLQRVAAKAGRAQDRRDRQRVRRAVRRVRRQQQRSPRFRPATAISHYTQRTAAQSLNLFPARTASSFASTLLSATPGDMPPATALLPHLRTQADFKKFLRYSKKGGAYQQSRLAESKFQQPSDLSRAIDVGLTVAPVGLIGRVAKGAYDVAQAARAAKGIEDVARGTAAATKVAKAAEKASAGRAAVGLRKAATAARESRAAQAARTVGQARATRVAGKVAARTTREGASATRRVTRVGTGIGAVAPPSSQGGNPLTVPLTNIEALGGALNPAGGHLTRTAEATGKSAIGFAVTPLEIAGNIGLSAGRAGSTALHAVGAPTPSYSGQQIAYPTVTQAKQLEAFGTDVVNTFGSGDTKKIQKAIEQDYGITLPLSAVPGFAKLSEKGRSAAASAIRASGHGERTAAAVESPIRAARSALEARRTDFQARYAEEVRRAEQENRPVNPAMARKARRQGQRMPPGEEPQPVFRRTAARRQRHLIAREHGVMTARIGGTERNLIREFEKLRRKVPGHRGVRGSSEIAPEDLAFSLATRGIPRNREEGVAEIKQLDRDVGRQHVATTEIHDAAAIRYIARNPEVVWGSASKPLWDLVDRFKKRSAPVTRYGGPSRARYIPIARAHGKPLPEELVPPEVEHMVPSQPGVSAKKALTKAAHERVKEAARLRRRAGTEISHAKAARREAIRNARYESAPAPGETVVYHATTPERAKRIMEEGRLRGDQEGRVWVGRTRDLAKASGRGKAIVQLKVRGRVPGAGDWRRIHASRLKPPALREARKAAQRATEHQRFAGEIRTRAKAVDAEAKQLREARKRTGVTRETTNRFVTSLTPLMRTVGETRGLEPPAMLHQQDALRAAEGVGSQGAREYRRGMPAGVQQSTGFVAERGRSLSGFESVVGNLRNAHAQEILRNHIANFVQRWHIRLPADFLRRQGLRTTKGMIQAPGQVWARALREGIVNERDVRFLDMGKVKGAITQALTPRVENFRDEFVKGQATIDASKIDPKRSYIAVPRAAHDEFFAQFAPASKVARTLRAVSSPISQAILFSPAWQVAQVIAESTQAALAVGPYGLAKGIVRGVKMPADLKLDFDSEIGSVSGGLPPGLQKRYLTTDLADRQRGAMRALDRSGWGQALKTIPSVFVRLDRAKGAAIRRGVALAKIERDLNGWHARMRAMSGTLESHLQELRGMTWTQRERWYTKHPDEMRKMSNYVMDTMGDWQTYTAGEHTLASAVLFYPYYRMSLKWTFQSFPARHPVKTAILGFLAAQHAQNLRKALHGEPTFFQDWATMLLDTGPKQVVPISLSRIVPGANPVVQATGEGVGPQLFQAANPIVGVPVSALFGVDPNTGLPIQGSKLNYILSTFARLPAPVRMIDAITGPRSASSLPIAGPKRGGDPISELINAMSPSPTQKFFSSTIVPTQLTTIGKMQDFIRFNRAMDQLRTNGVSDLKTSYAKGDINKDEYLHRLKLNNTAQANLDDLFKKYNIAYTGSDRAFFKRYGQTYSLGHTNNGGSWYGGSSTSGSSWYGSSGASTKSWYGGG